MNILIESNKMTKSKANTALGKGANGESNKKGILQKVLRTVGSLAGQLSNMLGYCGCKYQEKKCGNCTKKRQEFLEDQERKRQEFLEDQERKRQEFLKARERKRQAQERKRQAQERKRQANIDAEARKAEVERYKAEEHRKIEEEFKLHMSAIPFIKFVSLSSSTGCPDNKYECYGMYDSDEKIIFFVFDGKTSLITKIDFGDSDSAPNLYELGIAGALLFNEDGTYNIIEKNTAHFDIECGKNNTYYVEIDDE